MTRPCKMMMTIIGMVIRHDYRRHHNSFVPAYCCNPRHCTDALTSGIEKI